MGQHKKLATFSPDYRIKIDYEVKIIKNRKEVTMDNKLLFIYDRLMTQQEQQIAKLIDDMKFISFGCSRGKSYWIRVGNKKRTFFIPQTKITTKQLYGGIYLLNNYENNKYKLHSYYNNMYPYLNKNTTHDLYILGTTTVTPIKFNSLKELEQCKFARGRPIQCSSFIGNSSNTNITHNMKNYRYYGIRGTDTKEFLQLVKELNG